MVVYALTATELKSNRAFTDPGPLLLSIVCKIPDVNFRAPSQFPHAVIVADRARRNPQDKDIGAAPVLH